MTVPLWVLAGLSVVATLFVLPSAHLPFTWEHFTEGLFVQTRGGPPVERLPAVATFGIALVVAWGGAFVAWLLYKPVRGLAGDEALERAMPRLRRALVNKLYVDDLYERLIVRPLWAFARGTWRVVDATLIDGLFVNGTAQLVAWAGSMARRFQNGDVQRYAAVTALGVAALVYLFLARG
jgi:NADH-quinone oxidoreductase subunit L